MWPTAIRRVVIVIVGGCAVLIVSVVVVVIISVLFHRSPRWYTYDCYGKPYRTTSSPFSCPSPGQT